MLGGSYLATPISSWPRPTTTPTMPLPTCTTSTVPLPSHLGTSSAPTPHRGPRTSTARPCYRCAAARRWTTVHSHARAAASSGGSSIAVLVALVPVRVAVGLHHRRCHGMQSRAGIVMRCCGAPPLQFRFRPPVLVRSPLVLDGIARDAMRRGCRPGTQTHAAPVRVQTV